MIAPFESKPVVLDGAAYFLSFENERDSRLIADSLNIPTATAIFSAFVFRDSKRPITIEILRRLDLTMLAQELHGTDLPERIVSRKLN